MVTSNKPSLSTGQSHTRPSLRTCNNRYFDVSRIGGTSSLVKETSLLFFSELDAVWLMGPEARNFALSSLKTSTICLEMMLLQCFSIMIFLQKSGIRQRQKYYDRLEWWHTLDHWRQKVSWSSLSFSKLGFRVAGRNRARTVIEQFRYCMKTFQYSTFCNACIIIVGTRFLPTWYNKKNFDQKTMWFCTSITVTYW